MGEPPTAKMVAEYLSTADKEFPIRTVRDWAKRYGYDFQTGKWSTESVTEAKEEE